MKRGLCIAAISVLTLGGCISWSVDESWFFRPVARAEKVTTVAGLKLDAEERLTKPGPFSADFGRIFPNFPDRIPARISHDFVDLGGERIAITRVAGSNGSDDEPLIVHCGGESGDRRSHGTVYAGKILPWGEALLMDYPGYGDSSGQPTIGAMLTFQSRIATYLDGLASKRPLILWGHSLGGPVCAAIASQSTEVDAIVLEATAPNFSEVMDARKPWFTPPTLQLELTNGLKSYDVGEALSDFSGPIMVLGAGRDETFPVTLARSLAERLRKQGLAVTYLEYSAADHMNAALNGLFVRDAAGFFANVNNSRH
ncbi:MAG: alpha/beta hydrolase family protein [Hyphomonadaceae bacterium]|nr:alpha/beta hydrolase family protein [Hyphomonadaceae bacterium]